MKREIHIAGQPENKIGLEKLRVGVLGMGFMGGTHTQAWQRGKATFNWPIDVELVALFDTDEDTRDLHANRFDFQRVTGDWREVCEADDIDVKNLDLKKYDFPSKNADYIVNGDIKVIRKSIEDYGKNTNNSSKERTPNK